jgi:hypothetical protein
MKYAPVWFVYSINNSIFYHPQPPPRQHHQQYIKNQNKKNGMKNAVKQQADYKHLFYLYLFDK